MGDEITYPPPVPETCRYCGGEVRLVPDKEIYGQSYGSERFHCDSCGANVGVHDEGDHEGKPVGILADRELSSLRSRLHEHFDPLWRDTDLPRQSAYDWIFGDLMGLPPERRHTAMLTKDECRTLTTELKLNADRYMNEAEKIAKREDDLRSDLEGHRIDIY